MNALPEPYTVKAMSMKPLKKFMSGEEAWFWFMSSDKARGEGAKGTKLDTLSERPCDPDDIYSCVARLYRDGLLYPLHLEVLGEYGYLERLPYADDDNELVDWIFWRTAFDVLEPYLIEKEIVECPLQMS